MNMNSQAIERLGELIRERRMALRMTQESLAERSGNSQVYIGRIERGERLPSLTVLAEIATALGTNVVALLGGNPPEAVDSR